MLDCNYFRVNLFGDVPQIVKTVKTIYGLHESWSWEKIVETIFNNIVALRDEKEFLQQRLSEIADISRTGLRHIESGEKSPLCFHCSKSVKHLK